MKKNIFLLLTTIREKKLLHAPYLPHHYIRVNCLIVCWSYAKNSSSILIFWITLLNDKCNSFNLSVQDKVKLLIGHIVI